MGLAMTTNTLPPALLSASSISSSFRRPLYCHYSSISTSPRILSSVRLLFIFISVLFIQFLFLLFNFSPFHYNFFSCFSFWCERCYKEISNYARFSLFFLMSGGETVLQIMYMPFCMFGCWENVIEQFENWNCEQVFFLKKKLISFFIFWDPKKVNLTWKRFNQSFRLVELILCFQCFLSFLSFSGLPSRGVWGFLSPYKSCNFEVRHNGM